MKALSKIFATVAAIAVLGSCEQAPQKGGKTAAPRLPTTKELVSKTVFNTASYPDLGLVLLESQDNDTRVLVDFREQKLTKLMQQGFSDARTVLSTTTAFKDVSDDADRVYINGFRHLAGRDASFNYSDNLDADMPLGVVVASGSDSEDGVMIDYREGVLTKYVQVGISDSRMMLQTSTDFKDLNNNADIGIVHRLRPNLPSNIHTVPLPAWKTAAPK